MCRFVNINEKAPLLHSQVQLVSYDALLTELSLKQVNDFFMEYAMVLCDNVNIDSHYRTLVYMDVG